eukprot:366428-Chlamydomonas_euryale.AAC.7
METGCERPVHIVLQVCSRDVGTLGWMQWVWQHTGIILAPFPSSSRFPAALRLAHLPHLPRGRTTCQMPPAALLQVQPPLPPQAPAARYLHSFLLRSEPSAWPPTARRTPHQAAAPAPAPAAPAARHPRPFLPRSAPSAWPHSVLVAPSGGCTCSSAHSTSCATLRTLWVWHISQGHSAIASRGVSARAAAGAECSATYSTQGGVTALGDAWECGRWDGSVEGEVGVWKVGWECAGCCCRNGPARGKRQGEGAALPLWARQQARHWRVLSLEGESNALRLRAVHWV